MANFTTSGTHSITAQYSGDGDFVPATSNPWNATGFYLIALADRNLDKY